MAWLCSRCPDYPNNPKSSCARWRLLSPNSTNCQKTGIKARTPVVRDTWGTRYSCPRARLPFAARAWGVVCDWLHPPGCSDTQEVPRLWLMHHQAASQHESITLYGLFSIGAQAQEGCDPALRLSSEHQAESIGVWAKNGLFRANKQWFLFRQDTDDFTVVLLSNPSSPSIL
jgi:hypothetical protein